MGSTLSQEENSHRLKTSSDVKQSFEQVINAFKQPVVLPRHHPDSTSTAFSYSRARSVEPYHKSNIRQHHWQCQLCNALNQSDSDICLSCGLAKINVYIPVSNNNSNNTHINRTNESSSDQSVVLRHKDQNPNGDLIDEKLYRRSVLITHKRKADEHLARKHVEKLIDRLRVTNTKFADETFPATIESLYINGNSISQMTLQVLPRERANLSRTFQIQWLRPDEICPSQSHENQTHQWSVFRNPKPNDVVQGALGDCWFITALSVLAEKPEYLMRVLITKEFNEEGIYFIRLCKDGEWTQVIVDDRFPCTMSKRLAYSHAHRKQLWVPLIEKALAKLNGSYEAIIAGRCCEGLSVVTGSPCETLILGEENNPDSKNVDHNELWNRLTSAYSQGFLMCAMCSNNTVSNEEFQSNGLLNFHAYSLQDIQQSYDGRHKLVKLRNPWGGAHRWNGDWSDDSHLWDENPLLQQILLKEKRSKRDGVFWMPFSAFVKYFECVDICKIRPDWYEVRDSADFYPAAGMMQAYYLSLRDHTELDITLYRKINKNLRVKRSEVSLCVAIVNIEERKNGIHRIFSIPILSPRSQNKFITTTGFLQPGRYVILPFLFNPTNKPVDTTEFNIAVHSSHVIDLHCIKYPLTMQREFLIKLCLFYGQKVGTRAKIDHNDNDDVKIYELRTYWDGLILLVENRNQTKNLHFRFKCTLSQNAFMSRKDANYQSFDVIPSMHRQIIVMISRKNPSHSFTIEHNFNYQISSQSFIKISHGNKQKHWPNIDDSLFNEDIHVPQPISTL